MRICFFFFHNFNKFKSLPVASPLINKQGIFRHLSKPQNPKSKTFFFAHPSSKRQNREKAIKVKTWASRGPCFSGSSKTHVFLFADTTDLFPLLRRFVVCVARLVCVCWCTTWVPPIPFLLRLPPSSVCRFFDGYLLILLLSFTISKRRSKTIIKDEVWKACVRSSLISVEAVCALVDLHFLLHYPHHRELNIRTSFSFFFFFKS
jgi:hypothetical protein